ncbi:MAG TPA: hypothetical protein VHO72_04720 [Bacteroidales bacterium]|nr:hypothetical protein [Bacteroidales bacterium]
MLKDKLKQLLPHVVAIAIFIALSAVYFYPQLKGMQLRQGDIDRHQGMSKEITDFRAKYGAEPLWTNSMFAGMPAYQISTKSANYVDSIQTILILKPFSRPIGYVLLAMIAFYILMLCFGISPWISIIGAVAFGFASIFVLYLEGGHNSKVHAIALLPAVIGSILLAYRKNVVMGALLLAFFICLELSANHIQMTYYALFLIAAIIIVELIIHLKNKLLGKFIKVSLVLAVATIIGVLPAISNLVTTDEYSKYSTRGKSELTITPKSGQQTTSAEALESGYITEYNLSPGETWSLAIPNVKGGRIDYIGNKKDIMPKVDKKYAEYIAQYPSYWGEQASSGGAFYFGASVFLLFILGMVFIKDRLKWAFMAASLLAILLSLKSGVLIEMFINSFPLFNKFRDTKMILLIAQISFPFVGLWFIKELMNVQIDKKKLIYTLVAVNGLFIIFYIAPKLFFDFLTSAEMAYFNKQNTELQNNVPYLTQLLEFKSGLQDARILIFKKDVLRSLLFTILISGLVYMFVIKKLKANLLLLGIGVLILIDLWAVDKRYLNNEQKGREYYNWTEKKEVSTPYRASAADNFILQAEVSKNPSIAKKIDEALASDPKSGANAEEAEITKEKISFRELNFATNYRVVTLQNPFANAEISNFHKSIGGYHGAKLKKYQELIDFYLNDELGTFIKTLQDSSTNSDSIDNLFRNKIPVLGMLNTKYLIYNPGANPLVDES